LAEIEYSTSKAVYHTDRIRNLQQGRPIVPTEIQIDLEAWCNDNCSFCSYRKKDGYNNTMLKLIGGKSGTENKPIGKPSPESRIPDDIVMSIPKQMVSAGIPAIEITGGGEPTMHPKFTALIKELGVWNLDIGIVTNGSHLTDESISLIKKHATWIRISMDSSNAETHQRIHRTPRKDFERRIENIEMLVEDKPDSLTVGISFIITPDNIDDIKASAALYASLGVNHIRFSWMYDRQGTAGLTPEEIKYIDWLIPSLQKEHDTENFKIFNEKNRIHLYTSKNDFKTCHFQRFVMAIGADSGCYPCCIMKYNPDYQYANLKQNTLKEIVDSMKTDTFMKNLDPKRCYPCWLAPRNQAIAKAVEKPLHHNFI